MTTFTPASRSLRLERAKLIEGARDIANKDGVTNEDMAKATAMLAESENLLTRIDAMEKSQSLFAEMQLEVGHRASGNGAAARPIGNADQRRIFNSIIAGRRLPDEDKSTVADVLARDQRILVAMAAKTLGRLSAEDQEHYNASFGQISNAASGGTTTAGGYTIAPLFQAELLVALKAFGGMRQVARSMTTETGANLPWPVMDDTSNEATIIGTENTPLSADTDLVFGQKSIGAFTYVSGPLPVSLQLLQDSAFDFGSVIESAIVSRFGRKQNRDFTTGAGTTLPFGVVTGATLGVTGANGQTTTVLWQDLVKLIHSVDPAYRDGARFMFHDTTLMALKLMVDGQNRPLFLPGITAGAPDTIAGYPFTINQSMPVMAANAKSVLFGNFSSYIIRDVLGMQMMVLRERFADSLQAAWLAYMRSDGKLISAAQPIKWYANSSV